MDKHREEGEETNYIQLRPVKRYLRFMRNAVHLNLVFQDDLSHQRRYDSIERVAATKGDGGRASLRYILSGRNEFIGYESQAPRWLFVGWPTL